MWDCKNYLCATVGNKTGVYKTTSRNVYNIKCHMSLCETRSKQQKANNKRWPLCCGKSKPIKPVVKTEINEVKPSVSSWSELGVSSGYEEDTWKKERVDEADFKCFYSSGFLSEDRDGVEWVRCQKCLKWAYNTLCADCRKKAFVHDRCKKWQTLFYWGSYVLWKI